MVAQTAWLADQVGVQVTRGVAKRSALARWSLSSALARHCFVLPVQAIDAKGSFHNSARAGARPFVRVEEACTPLIEVDASLSGVH